MRDQTGKPFFVSPSPCDVVPASSSLHQSPRREKMGGHLSCFMRERERCISLQLQFSGKWLISQSVIHLVISCQIYTMDSRIVLGQFCYYFTIFKVCSLSIYAFIILLHSVRKLQKYEKCYHEMNTKNIFVVILKTCFSLFSI